MRLGRKLPRELSFQVKVLGRCLTLNYRRLLRTVAWKDGSVSKYMLCKQRSESGTPEPCEKSELEQEDLRNLRAKPGLAKSVISRLNDRAGLRRNWTMTEKAT